MICRITDDLRLTVPLRMTAVNSDAGGRHKLPHHSGCQSSKAASQRHCYLPIYLLYPFFPVLNYYLD